MEDVGDIAFELRRHLNIITMECDSLLEAPSDSLSPEAHDAIERIDEQSTELAALVARLETESVANQPIPDIDAVGPQEPASDRPGTDAPIHLSVAESSFIKGVATELREHGHAVILRKDDEQPPEEATLVADILETLEPAAPSPDALVSVIDGEDDCGPILGASGILSPAGSEETLLRVLDGFHDPEEPTAPVSLVGTDESNSSSLIETLEHTGRNFYRLGSDDDIPADSRAVLLAETSATVGELERLRRRRDSRRLPVLIIGTPPNGGEWMPTIGGRTFVQRPLTESDFVGELLVTLQQP